MFVRFMTWPFDVLPVRTEPIVSREQVQWHYSSIYLRIYDKYLAYKYFLLFLKN